MNTFRLLEISEPKFPYKFRQSKDAYDALKDYGRADRECFLVLFLNTQNVLLDCEVIGVGAVDRAAVFVSEVIKAALLRGASSIICAHNHPSGDVTPSRADLEITAQIMLACESVQIRMLDHIIIGRSMFLSLADSDKLPELERKVEDALKCVGGGSC